MTIGYGTHLLVITKPELIVGLVLDLSVFSVLGTWWHRRRRRR